MAFIRKTLPLLILFFVLSVAVRLPNIGRPLSKHHEFCTAVSLRIMEIWYIHGASTYHFNPAMTFGDSANHYINNFASGSGQMMDAQGNYYYVSHPPLAYYVPYALFKSVNIYPTVTGIQYFHMLFHFLCALGVFWIVCVLYGRSLFGEPFFAAVAAFVIYLFSPATMWFQSNTYMADMFVQVPFVYGLLVVLLARRYEYKTIWLLPLCLLVFVMVYTSWLGVFFDFVLACYLFLGGINGISRWWWTGLVKFCMFSALSLIAYQYSSINGWHAYLAEATQRAGERSVHGIASLPLMYFDIIKNHVYNYAAVYLAILVLAVMGRKMMKQIFRSHAVFLGLAAIPVMLLHMVLADYSGHAFVTLYAAPFWSVLLAVMLSEVTSVQPIRNRLVAGLVVVFVAQYYYINRPGDTSISGERYDRDMNFGNAIAAQANADDVVFLLGEKPSPQVVFYAHRNIQWVMDKSAAIDFLKAHGMHQGALFQPGPDGSPVLVERISIKAD